ncbi:GDT1-like protein 4 isoform X4 [Pieris napi]|uniref:GDT1-like protein 4 isoform X4 n=1 Tax=Pieris napi TaxID=78633 RepID=UPI001FBA53F8|nr:GDT1-like protein 4 isoform X4 [Pieris napi]
MISDSPKSSERQVRFSPEIINSDVTYRIPNGKSPQSIEQTANDSITDQDSSQSNARRRLSIKDRKESISPERDSGIGLKSPQNAKTEYISPDGESHTGEKTPEVNVSSQKTLEVMGQKSEPQSQVSPEDPQAGPSNRPEMREDKEETAEMLEQGLAERRKRRSAVFKVLLQAATLTFLAEWGDRSQLATVVLATREDVFGVVVGGSLGHALCTGLAVIGGRMVAQKISVRTVTIIGGIVFLFFAVSALIMGPGE